MDNMTLYNQAKPVPKEAVKTIEAGRLKGFSDINPMWRIKRLTEMFGPCGIGWWYVIKDQRLEAASEKEIRAFVDIELTYVYNGHISQPIPGVGGSSFVTQERSGAYTSDECFKMALTDAISVAAKAIGVGADIYFEKDRDKYTASEENGKPKQQPKQQAQPQQQAPQDVRTQHKVCCSDCGKEIIDVKFAGGNIMKAEEIISRSMNLYQRPLCIGCAKKANSAN